MLTKGPAKKVTIHLSALDDAIMTFLLRKGVSGAAATRAYSGFGSHQTLHTPKIKVMAEHLPVRIEFVEIGEKVQLVLPALYEMGERRIDRSSGHHGGKARAEVIEAGAEVAARAHAGSGQAIAGIHGRR